MPVSEVDRFFSGSCPQKSDSEDEEEEASEDFVPDEVRGQRRLTFYPILR